MGKVEDLPYCTFEVHYTLQPHLRRDHKKPVLDIPRSAHSQQDTFHDLRTYNTKSTYVNNNYQ